MFIQFIEFSINATKDKQNGSFRYRMICKGSMSVLQYWQTDGRHWPDLHCIAIRLFSMTTSSAASERNFSTMGFIHSKLRNSLGPKTVEKLVYIKCNVSAFNNVTKNDIKDYGNESESNSDSEVLHD